MDMISLHLRVLMIFYTVNPEYTRDIMCSMQHKNEHINTQRELQKVAVVRNLKVGGKSTLSYNK